MMRQPIHFLVGGISLLLVTGCAALSPVQVGQTAGTMVGAVAAPGLGAPLGALLGTLVGKFFQSQVDKVTETRERKELTDQFGSNAQITDATRTAVRNDAAPARAWVDEVERDGQVLAGHFELRSVE